MALLPRPAHRSLWRRVVTVNLLVLVLAVVALVAAPVTVSARPVASEVVVLAVGLLVAGLANAWVVRQLLRPLDELAARLDHEGGAGPTSRLEPRGGVAGRLALAVNGLLDRIEDGQRQAGAAALAAQEAERARIAQELHDGVGQSLTAIMLEADALDRASGETGGRHATQIRETARASLAEVRDVARQLRPHVLEDLGLRSALAALTSELFAHGDTHVRRGIAPGLPPLDEATELVVYRVAQEALTNAARHAGASTVEVRLGPVGEEVELVVADDGRGLPPDADGTGLRGMRERAATVGGRLQVGVRAGGGTVVTLVVPARVREQP